MEDTTDSLRQQMTETRSALSDKLEALEDRLMSTVKETTDAVTETVGSVKDAVTDTVTSVTESVSDTVESVKGAFDVSAHIERHPWLALGGALLVGYLGYRLLSSSQPPPAPPAPPVGPPAPEDVPVHAEAEAPGSPNWLGVLSPVTTALQELAVGATTGVIGRMALDALPDSVQDTVQNALDRVTQSLGGQPMHFDPAPPAR